MGTPIESVETKSVTGAPQAVRCPRCSAPIAGDFKFCPTCAYRLRPVDEEGRPPPPSHPRKPWAMGLVMATVVAALLACALLGVYLLQPSWLLRTEPVPTTTPAPRDWAALASPAIGIDDLPSELVELPAGYAYLVALDAVSDLGRLDRTSLQEQFPKLESVQAYLWYPLLVSKYEITRGQYDEFLRNLESHPDRVPKSWRDPKKPDAEVDLLLHVPASWRVKDEPGRETSGWAVADVDRNLPVTQVSAIDARGFCEWASDRFQIHLRLPYAMEWVRAARAGKLENRWPWGQEQFIYACNNQASFGRPQFVHFPYPEPPTLGGATGEGLYAMAGNVMEWAIDHDFRLQPQALGQPPTVIWKPYDVPSTKVLAYGGSFRSGIDDCQVESYVTYYTNDRGRDDVGFRVVAFVE